MEICSGACQGDGESEIWDVPNVMIGLGFIDDGPIRNPDANVRIYDLLKEQNQRASRL